MSITIKDLKSKDYDIARQYAIEGMKLDCYCKYAHELYFYSRYYFYMELLKATHILAAYENDKLIGILLAQINHEPTKINSFWLKTFVNSMTYITNKFFKGESIYNNTNKEMLDKYKINNKPDGEILFFCVDKNVRGKGIGTLLLKELEKVAKGKKMYLYTDSFCTYQFYEKRGFNREQQRNIELSVHGNPMSLTCFLFSKVL